MSFSLDEMKKAAIKDGLFLFNYEFPVNPLDRKRGTLISLVEWLNLNIGPGISLMYIDYSTCIFSMKDYQWGIIKMNDRLYVGFRQNEDLTFFLLSYISE